MTTVRELVTKWGFDVDDEPLNKMEASIESIKLGLAAVLGAGVAAAGTLFGFAKVAANVGDQAYKAGQRLGLTAEAFQELSFAANLSDISNEEFIQSMQLLSKTAIDAGQGNEEAIKSFKRLGITAQSLKGLSTDQVLAKVSDQFAALPDGAAKSTLALELFGRAGGRMIPLLNGGSKELRKLRNEARDYGIISDADAKLSEDFNDSLTRLWAAVRGLGNSIGVKLMPGIMDLINGFREQIVTFRKSTEFTEGVAVAMRFLKNIVKVTVAIVRTLWLDFKGLIHVLGGVEHVLNMVVIALGVLGSSAILGGLGLATQAVMGFAGALTLANAQALLVPILIGGLIVALGLIAEDLFVYNRGGKSLFGLLIDNFDLLLKKFSDFYKEFGKDNPLIAFLKDINNYLNPLVVMLDILEKMDVLWSKFTATGLGKSITRIGEFGMDPQAQSQKIADDISNARKLGKTYSGSPAMNDAVSSVNGLLNPGSPVAAPNGGGGQVNNFNTEVNVNANGMGPDQAKQTFGDAIQKEHDRMMRESLRSLKPVLSE